MIGIRTLIRPRSLAALAVSLLLAAPAVGQIIPKDAAEPVQVHKSKGEFAKKLSGAAMPTGKGWKAASDREKRLQIMVPDGWKADNFPDGDAILRVTPPGGDKDAKAILIVTLTGPRDADPLEVDPLFADVYVEGLAKDPALARVKFTPTDSAYLTTRGMKFALAGGSILFGKETFQQQQLVYISEDRIVTLQFTAREKEFAKYAPDVARIFASYQTLGAIRSE